MEVGSQVLRSWPRPPHSKIRGDATAYIHVRCGVTRKDNKELKAILTLTAIVKGNIGIVSHRATSS